MSSYENTIRSTLAILLATVASASGQNTTSGENQDRRQVLQAAFSAVKAKLPEGRVIITVNETLIRDGDAIAIRENATAMVGSLHDVQRCEQAGKCTLIGDAVAAIQFGKLSIRESTAQVFIDSVSPSNRSGPRGFPLHRASYEVRLTKQDSTWAVTEIIVFQMS